MSEYTLPERLHGMGYTACQMRAAYADGFAAGAASRDAEVEALRADALRWDKVKRASSELTLRLHNLRCEYREAAIDAAIAAEATK